MNNFNLSKWIESRGKFKDLVIDDVELQIVSLDDELIGELKEIPTYQEMFDFVANVGLSHERNRIYDDEELSKDLHVIWALEELNKDVEPSIKEQIVDAICELSEIKDILTAKQEEEELAKMEAEEELNVIDGDNLPGESVTLEQLNNDAAIVANMR